MIMMLEIVMIWKMSTITGNFCVIFCVWGRINRTGMASYTGCGGVVGYDMAM